MSLLKEISPEKATGKVAELYEGIKQFAGAVPNGMKLFSANPSILEMRVASISYYMQNETLSQQLMAFIRFLVSIDERCEYCININQNILMRSGITAEEINATKDDPSKAPIGERDKTMLIFVLKLVKDAKSIEAKDIENVRSKGWTDADMLAAANHGAMQVGLDMMLNGFKVKIDGM